MAFTKISIAGLLILTIVIVCESRKDHKIWAEHFSRVSQFKCGIPQPREVLVKDLVDVTTIPNRKILPFSTVLHRCESAGCCPHGQQCSVVALEDVSLVFGVLGAGPGMKFVTVEAQNHTECGCANIVDLPK